MAGTGREPPVGVLYPLQLTCETCGAVAKFRCARCGVGYCSRAHQRAAWHTNHKQSCRSLDDAVRDALDRGLPRLQALALVPGVSDNNGHVCWICLEPGTAASPLVSGGCGCRGGATVGHVECFVAALQARRATSSRESTVMRCPTCTQQFFGYVRAKANLAFAEDLDPDHLARTVADAAAERSLADRCQLALFHTADALVDAARVTGQDADHVTALRVSQKRLDVLVPYLRAREKRSGSSDDDDDDDDANDSNKSPARMMVLETYSRMASTLSSLRRYDEAAALLRKLRAWRNRDTISTTMLALSLLDAANVAVLDDAIDAARRAREAELLLREILGGGRRNDEASSFETPNATSAADPVLATTRGALAQALALQGKFDEADRENGVSLDGARRIFGPAHGVTLKFERDRRWIAALRARRASDATGNGVTDGPPASLSETTREARDLRDNNNNTNCVS
mmetsp:Transcript_18783/g.74965  ORF Transcript_18783/g.74965 Transcript_18783/m.74965 type:complete len:459 (+) Transcript_18783:31-1407(+)